MYSTYSTCTSATVRMPVCLLLMQDAAQVLYISEHMAAVVSSLLVFCTNVCMIGKIAVR